MIEIIGLPDTLVMIELPHPISSLSIKPTPTSPPLLSKTKHLHLSQVSTLPSNPFLFLFSLTPNNKLTQISSESFGRETNQP